MAHAVRIPIHDQECVLPARDHEMRGVVTRLRRRGQEVGIARFLLEILDAPGTPKRFKFCFRKFHRVAQPEANLQIAAVKSSGF